MAIDVPPDVVTYVQVVAPSSAVGVTPSSPDSTATGLPSVWLWGMNVRIPPGHAGTTGIALLDGAQFIIPYDTSDAWLIGDDDDLDFNYGKQVGALTTLATYNSGTYTHGWQVRLVYSPLSVMAAAGVSITTPDLADLHAQLAATFGEYTP